MNFDCSVFGAGAFGTSLAISQARFGRKIGLWGRDSAKMEAMKRGGVNAARLPDVPFPETLEVCADIERAASAPVLLLAVPTQSLRGFLEEHASVLKGKTLVLCCKGIERGTGFLPTQVVRDIIEDADCAVLTGPSFAVDIGRGKPTALTLASDMGEEKTTALQASLSNSVLRLYASDDPVGAQLGGALKNVVAIAAGVSIGAGLGESARSALMTRGFAEIVTLAAARGAKTQSLYGLAGFGDLVLTCTSTKSRNYAYGIDLGGETETDRDAVVEGIMTAHAICESVSDIELPITRTVSALIKGDVTLEAVIQDLMTRPLRNEF
ncbi:NAD(P)H-dependent glycerol-3-phosphate dehydrogenase [Planktotalea sp.]|uniref:NAD(P)H-dependent glycerol-3-phosphate dehydrogenase n=1 Tax=Planktotalea sp. TaxID=2029877 RepID=UPI003D6B9A3A